LYISAVKEKGLHNMAGLTTLSRDFQQDYPSFVAVPSGGLTRPFSFCASPFIVTANEPTLK
jgi:hypothetical protein